jgi:hypothetical protein
MLKELSNPRGKRLVALLTDAILGAAEDAANPVAGMKRLLYTGRQEAFRAVLMFIESSDDSELKKFVKEKPSNDARNKAAATGPTVSRD